MNTISLFPTVTLCYRGAKQGKLMARKKTTTKTKGSTSLQNLNRSGRAVGSKNKATLFKEVVKNGFEEELARDFVAVVRAVIDKAKGRIARDKEGNPLYNEDGTYIREDADMTAAKILLDRAVPVGEKDSGSGRFQGGITINIQALEAPSIEMVNPPIEIEDLDHE